MPREINITGKKFNLLTAIKKIDSKKWLFICECGNKKIISKKQVMIGATKSCGCLKNNGGERKQTGLSKTRFYHIYLGIKSRCLNKNNKSFKNYGGRGIRVYWDNITQFRDDMYESYLKHCKEFGEKETTIERIDNNKGYFKENCKWATYKEQSENRRKIYKYSQGNISLYEYCKNNNLDYKNYLSYFMKGFSSVEEIDNFKKSGKVNKTTENKKLILLQFINFLEKIPKRYKKIIIDRYGLIDNKIKTYQEIADKNNVSRQRIQQMEKILFDKIYYSML